MSQSVSTLQEKRASYTPKIPNVFRGGLRNIVVTRGDPTTAVADVEAVERLFPLCFGQPVASFEPSDGVGESAPRNVAVVLSGGQAPGGHNVLAGLFDALKTLDAGSRLLGFLGGLQGLIDDDYEELTAEGVEPYRNTGGFDIIGSGRTKLETEKQFVQVAQTCERNDLSAIVIVGGDDSNTNACVLAEWMRAQGKAVKIVGVPKTIDGDLRNDLVEISFGFDTAVKTYSELIGNICRDANSAKKYWHFIKLMGRSASHIALEAALQTQPNIAIISEEVAAKKMTLNQVVDSIVDVVVARARRGKNFGVVLVPEGLIEFIPEINMLLGELNEVLVEHGAYYSTLYTTGERLAFVNSHLGRDASYVFSSLPADIQEQLTLDRDSHGNVQVSRIETEALLEKMVARKLNELKAEGVYTGAFSSQTHFFGYEGRCAPPSNFDADYGYSLGYVAAALIASGLTGYMACVRGATKPADQWEAAGVPLTMMMNIERRQGRDVPVIQKALTDLEGKPFGFFAEHRHEWAIEDRYLYPGPIQYFGPPEICDQPTKTLALERS
jgi:pyrophosphate--fructose-6-phosphate 1-phosphotransferase